MGKTDIKKLKNIINCTRSSLKWKVVECKNSDYDLASILSNNFTKTHNIFYPKTNNGTNLTSLLEILHELCHATFAEQIHPQLATFKFTPGTHSSAMDVVSEPCKSAGDWFVYAHLHKLCPDLFKEDISELFDICYDGIKREQERYCARKGHFLVGLVLASSIKWLRAEIIIEGDCKPIVDAFMSVDPGKPSLNALVLIINRLLAIQSNLQVKAVFYEEYQTELFEITERCLFDNIHDTHV